VDREINQEVKIVIQTIKDVNAAGNPPKNRTFATLFSFLLADMLLSTRL